jgi:predicted acetyltransferase
MDTTLRKATEPDFLLISNLVPYYVYDMSGDMGWSPNSEGRYGGCDNLAEYWEKPDHDPYIIMVDGMVGGFALVRPYPADPARTEIGEFFVLRKYQGHGVGAASAFWLFDAYAGKWLVRVLDANARARRFWEKVIAAYTHGRFTKTAEQYHSPYSGTWAMQFYQFETTPDHRGRRL